MIWVHGMSSMIQAETKGRRESLHEERLVPRGRRRRCRGTRVDIGRRTLAQSVRLGVAVGGERGEGPSRPSRHISAWHTVPHETAFAPIETPHFGKGGAPAAWARLHAGRSAIISALQCPCQCPHQRPRDNHKTISDPQPRLGRAPDQR